MDARPPCVDTSTAFRGWRWREIVLDVITGAILRVVVVASFSLRWSVGIGGMREIFVRVREVEVEECGGVVGEWTRCKEWDVTD